MSHSPPKRYLIAANWKMHGLKAAVTTALAIAESAKGHKAQVALFPPATLLPVLSEALKDTDIILGGQDNHHADEGAYTGDISARMLHDAGARMVILGHSERRHGHL